MNQLSSQIYPQPSAQDDPKVIVVQGRRLSAKQAARLESQLRKSPADLRSHLLLLGYYWARQSREASLVNAIARHFIWLIDNAPDSGVLEYPFFYRDSNAFRRVKSSWSKAIKRSPDNLVNLRRAANSCVMAAPATSVSYLRRAQKLQPENEDWPHQISHIYVSTAKNPSAPADCLAVRQALRAGKQALKLHKKFPCQSYLELHMEMTVSRLADTALKFSLYDDAVFFGDYLIERFAEWESQSNNDVQMTRKRKFEAHMGHSICGRAALGRGDLARAREHLSLMPLLGDPDWRHDLLLARALLKAQEREVVLSYLRRCAMNLKERMFELDHITADPKKLPPVLLMQRDSAAPGMNLTEFLKAHTMSRLVAVNEWSSSIRHGRRPKLPEYI